MFKFFRKKPVFDIKKIADRIIEETKICNACLNFIEESGNYKKRQHYKLSDHELKEKINALHGQFIMLQQNMIIADEVIQRKPKQLELYQKLCAELNEEIKTRAKKEVKK